MLFIFYKYHGAGNDFIILDNRKLQFGYDRKMIRKLCDRHIGIGADGLMTIENDLNLDFKMRYFNADGLEGSMCGNGGRCLVHFVKMLGIINKNTVEFTATDGIHTAEILSNDIIKLKMQDMPINSLSETKFGSFIDTGSPHLICYHDSIEAIDVFSEGKKLRYNDIFKDINGVNVNYVSMKDNIINIRTYERGVEDETLACGTGSVAVALVSFLKNGNLQSPITINALGGKLKVYFTQESDYFRNVWLEGPAKFVFKTELDLDNF